MKNLLKEIGRASFIGVLLFIVVGVINYLNGYFYTAVKQVLIDFLYNQLYSIVLYMANMMLFKFLLKYFGDTFFKFKNLVRSILGGILVTVICIFLLRLFKEMFIDGESWSDFVAGEETRFYYSTFIISMVISIIFYGIYYYRFKQENRVKEQKIIAGTASAKFDALKNQLDPHFLFNSLNVLTSLIEEDADQAQKFTTSLSKIYRYVLEQKNKDLVTVDEELQFAKTYIRLLKMRFEDSIVFDIPEKCSNPEAKIVPLSLQLLLENAVKHNIVTSTRPLHIKVFEEGGSLVIQNNLQEKQVVKKSSGVGLRNIQQRYSILSDKEVQISKTPKNFKISLPMLTKRVSMKESQQIYIGDKRYQKAKERVNEIKGFYGNLIAYCIVISFLTWINIKSTSFPWAIFPAMGWGFGLLIHGMEAFGYNPLWGKNWEEKKIRELMDNDKF